MKTLMIILLLGIAGNLAAQHKEEPGIKKVIHDLFSYMQRGDTAAIRPLFVSGSCLHTARQDKQTGAGYLENESLDSFLIQVASVKAKKLAIEERVITCEIRVDVPLASAWVEYEFYVNGKFSHKGIDAFYFIKDKTGWRITQLYDTRRKN